MVCLLIYLICGVVTPIHICWSYGSLHTIWSCDSLHVRCVFFHVWLGSSLVQTGHHHSFRGPKKKSALSVIQFVVSCRLTFRIFRFECDFSCDVFICSASHLPLPSHTTHSVGSTGRALWVYAVCGVWGGWVGFLRWSLCSLRWRENFRDTLHCVSCVSS